RSLLPHHPRRVADDPAAGRHVARHQRARLDERAGAHADPFQNRRVRADPDVVLQDYGASHNRGSGPPLAQGGAGDGVGNPLRGADRVEVRVGDGGVPADDNVAADAQYQLAQQDGVGEIAIIADLNSPLLAEGEVDAVQGAVSADDERRVAPAPETLEGMAPGQDAVRPNMHVGRQLTVRPAAGFKLLAGTHVSPPLPLSLPPPRGGGGGMGGPDRG